VYRRLGRPLWAGLDVMEKNKSLLTLPEIEPWLLGRPSHCLVAIPTVQVVLKKDIRKFPTKHYSTFHVKHT
jgi:hypothetical protein